MRPDATFEYGRLLLIQVGTETLSFCPSLCDSILGFDLCTFVGNSHNPDVKNCPANGLAREPCSTFTDRHKIDRSPDSKTEIRFFHDSSETDQPIDPTGRATDCCSPHFCFPNGEGGLNLHFQITSKIRISWCRFPWAYVRSFSLRRIDSAAIRVLQVEHAQHQSHHTHSWACDQKYLCVFSELQTWHREVIFRFPQIARRTKTNIHEELSSWNSTDLVRSTSSFQFWNWCLQSAVSQSGAR